MKSIEQAIADEIANIGFDAMANKMFPNIFAVSVTGVDASNQSLISFGWPQPLDGDVYYSMRTEEVIRIKEGLSRFSCDDGIGFRGNYPCIVQRCFGEPRKWWQKLLRIKPVPPEMLVGDKFIKIAHAHEVKHP